MKDTTSSQTITGWRFGLLCALQIWVAHGIAFLFHEYAHSFTATLLGFKSNPWLLHFGTPTFANMAILWQVNENVDYASIYAQGHGYLAALIAFAGFGIGNVILYLICLWTLYTPKVCVRPLWRLFFFWLCLMNVGNFYDYVPIRTFYHGGDIGHIVRGLGCSPWLVLIVLGIPTAWAIWHLFWRLLPRTMKLAFPDNSRAQKRLRIISICLIFDFFGGIGLFVDSLVSNGMAWASLFIAICAIVYSVYKQSARGVSRSTES